MAVSNVIGGNGGNGSNTIANLPYYTHQPSDSTGATDITVELMAAQVAANLVGKRLFILPSTIYLKNFDPNTYVNMTCEPNTVTIVNDYIDPAIKTTSRKTYLQANTIGLNVIALTQELYLDTTTTDNDFVTTLQVTSTAGFIPGEMVHVHSKDCHPYVFTQIGTNPLATTNGSKTIVVTHASHGYATTNEIRFWDTSGLIANIGGIPAAEIFSSATGVVDHTITRIDSNTFSFTVATTNATSTGSFGGTTIRNTRGKVFYGQSAKILGVTPTKIYLDSRIRLHDDLKNNIRVNTVPVRPDYISNFKFMGKIPAGEVTKIRPTAFGTGYTSTPTVVVTGGSGAGFAATAVRVGSEIVDYIITNHGTGYIVGDTINITNTGGGGTGATASGIVGGTCWDSDYDVSASYHNHTLSLRYAPGCVIENIVADDLWEGAIEPRFSSYAIIKGYRGSRLCNYRTGSTVGNYAGRLGYHVDPANRCLITDIIATHGRHLYTDDELAANTYSTDNWIEYQQGIDNVIDNVKSFNCMGTLLGPHEGCNGLIATNIVDMYGGQGNQGSSYRNAGVQLRGSNITVIGYRKIGGVDGVRYQDTEQPNSKHFVDEFYFEGLQDSTGNAMGVRHTGTTTAIHKSTIELGSGTFKNCDRAFRVDTGGVLLGKGDIVCTQIRHRGGQVETGGYVQLARFHMDYQENPVNPSSRVGVTMTGISTFICNELKLTLGATKNPSTVIVNNDSAAGKTIDIGSYELLNPHNVAEPTLISSTSGHHYTWAGISRQATVRVPQVDMTATTTNQLLMQHSGETLLGNNASAQTFLLPNNLPKGWKAKVIQMGAGQITFTPNGAYGFITFTANPSNGNTITLNGVTWTFVTSGATGAQTNIGASLSATLTQLAIDLNGSANVSITPATYANLGGTQLTISHDTAGTGTAYTLAASVATVSGANLQIATRQNRSGHTKVAGQYGVVELEVVANADGRSAAYVLNGDTAA